MDAVTQQDATGCAIACVAAISGNTYPQIKAIANDHGISVQDPTLWSDTYHIRHLLNLLGVKVARSETPFAGWDDLPDCALLAIKWHLEKSIPFWHWVVFVREEEREYVLDSSRDMKNNVRTDFGRMHPKWFMAVTL